MRPHLFFHTALLFIAAQITSLVVTDQLRAVLFPSISQVSSAQSLMYFLIIFFSVTLFLLVLFQLYRGGYIYRILFTAVCFIGLFKVFELVFPSSLALTVSLIFVLGLYLIPAVWTHNVIVIVASAGIGPVFGLQFSMSAAFILLAILSLYDVIAVFITRHMVGMAHEMIKNQASFALIIPEHWKDFRSPLSSVRPGSGFLIVGGGDVILPMFFTTSLYLYQPQLAYWAVGGMAGGLFFNHMWLMNHRRPLPALPFIALGAALGCALGYFFITAFRFI